MLFDKLIAKKVAAAESEILKKHYAEVENIARLATRLQTPHPNDEGPRAKR